MAEVTIDPVMKRKADEAAASRVTEHRQQVHPLIKDEKSLLNNAEDTGGEQHFATNTDIKKSPAQIITADMVTLDLKQREAKRDNNDSEYQEYLSEKAGEIQRLFTQESEKGNLTSGFRNQVRSEAVKHGIDLSMDPTQVVVEHLTARHEEEKGKVGPDNIIKTIKYLGGKPLDILRSIQRGREKKKRS